MHRDKEQQDEFDYNTKNPNKFDKLRWDWVLGIITNQDVVSSQQHHYSNAPTHEDLWPLNRYKRWRWSFSDGIDTSVYSRDDFEKADFQLIRDHLKREYGIKFWENGYHDIDYFISRMTSK